MTIKTSKTNSKLCDGIETKIATFSLFALVIFSFFAFSTIPSAEADSDLLASNGMIYSPDGKTIISCPSDMNGPINIPDGVESIGEYAFYGCNGITGTIYIPASVKTIGQGAFAGCGGTGFCVDADNTEFASVNGLLLTKDLGTVVACPTGFSGDLVIPDTVTEIGYLAFLNCSNLGGSLIITENVDTIREFAFAGCSGLKYIGFGCDSDVAVAENAFLGIEFLDECGNMLAHTGANLGNNHFAGFDSKLTVNADYPSNQEGSNDELAVKIIIVAIIFFFAAIIYRFRETILWRK